MNETVRRGLGGTVAFAAVVALLLHVVTDPHLAQWISNLAYVGGSAGGAWLAFGGARRRRGTARHAWRAIGAGQLSWLVANAIWGVHESILGEHLPVPSVFDVFYGLAMLLVLVGVTLLVAPQLRAASPARTVLDVLLVAASGFYVAWVTLLRDLPELGWSAERAVTWLYPTFDVALACVAVIGLSRATRNDRVRWSMLAVGVLGMSAADGVWAYANLHGMFESGSTLDALWLAAYLVIGLAARTDIDDRPDAEHGAVSERWTALVPCVPVLLVIAGAALSHGPADSVRLVAGLAVFVLLCVRQVVAVLENQRLARDLECRVAVRTAELGQSEALLRAIGERISDGVLVLGPDFEVLHRSAGFGRIAGHHADAVDPASMLRYILREDRAALTAAMLDVRTRPGDARVVGYRVTRVDGTIGYGEATITNMLDHPDVGGFLLVVADRSDQRELEDRLRHRAEHDALTGLANRAALADALEARLDAGEQPAVVLLDLDGFKGLNDSLGHVAGDQLLRVVANRLRAAVRPTDVVARLGGDEFAVVVDGGHQDAFDVATRITERLDEQVAVLGRVVRCRASVGVTTIGSSADELIRNADLAMYEAKAGGRNRVEVFEDRLHQRLVRRMRLEEALAHAVDRNELRLVHQPVVDLETGRLLGAEALLRWRHAGEEIEPSEFVPLAEETGLITSIGRWVLREACAAAARWHRLRPDGPPPRVAVNVSALQLGSGTLVTDVADALTAARLSPSCLTIEITESAVMARSEEIVGRLSALRAVGVRVSIDDFGTGHSSLGRLRFLPVDEVKIDRSFVSGAGDAVDIAVVEAVLALAGSLGLEVVAEGIETRDQLDALRLRGCEMGQGWLFGAGVPSSGIERLLLDEVDNRTLNFSV